MSPGMLHAVSLLYALAAVWTLWRLARQWRALFDPVWTRSVKQVRPAAPGSMAAPQGPPPSPKRAPVVRSPDASSKPTIADLASRMAIDLH